MRLIDADALIDDIRKHSESYFADDFAHEWVDKQPTVQPTLYGYDLKHLELIAGILQKEDLPPERVTEALTDIGRIVGIVQDEFEETLRRTVRRKGAGKERC